jgi:hypothetical protein
MSPWLVCRWTFSVATSSHMELERQVKRQHLGLLVRVRNLLTELQRKKLQELRGAP